jgi:hypothetical protein
MNKSVTGTTAIITDEVEGLAIEATFAGGALPSTADTFAPGCRLVNSNSGVTYINIGTSAVPSWDSNVETLNPQETATGTYTLSPYGHTIIDSSAGAVTGTLGSAATPGTIKTITMQDATASSTVSITNHVTSDPEVATFDAVDETLVLVWTGTEWATIHASATFV